MPISGKGADVEHGSAVDVVDVVGFTFNEICATTRFGSSDSAGFKKTIAGTRSASGEVRTKYDEAAAAPALKSGDAVTLDLKLDANDHISVPAVINSRSLDVDLDDGVVVAEVLGYESNGAWTETHA